MDGSQDTRSIGFDLAVLDMAGTTVAATNDVPSAFRGAFAGIGVDLSDALVAHARGRSKKDAILELVRRTRPDVADPEPLALQVYEDFRARLHEALSASVRPIEGAEATIAWLRGHGCKVALATGFARDTTDLILGRLGWSTGFVDAVVCDDDVARGRPAPDLVLKAMERTGVADASRVLAVGDTLSDLESGLVAKAGGLVGVLSGAHTRRDLELIAEATILTSLSELPGWLEERRAWAPPRVPSARG